MALLYFFVLLAGVILARGENRGSVYFVETRIQKYLQSGSEEPVFSEADVAASVAVLLGVDPPSTMSQSSASKLEELLKPDPFTRPRRVVSLLLESFDADYLRQKNITQALGVKSAEHRYLSVRPSRKPAKHLAGKPVRLESLNFPVEDLDLSYLKQELQGLFEITIPSGENLEEEIVTLSLADISLKLDLFKRSDYVFAVDLVSLLGGIKRAVSAHEELADASDIPQFFFGTFSGIKALREDREDEDVAKASEFVLFAVSKLFEKLDSVTNGKLVGVVAFPPNGAHHVVRELVGKHYHSRRSRLLEKEKKTQTVQQLSRRTLVASVSIILIVATLLGTWCLCYMPFTRDSLLYSGAKLD